jgi:histidine ammonia-lyase
MIRLDGRSLTITDVVAVARERAPVGLTPAVEQAVADGEALLGRMIADGAPIYGVTTGFGALDGRAVTAERN